MGTSALEQQAISDFSGTEERMLILEKDPDAGKNLIRNRILHVLSIYPKLSMSMIQVAIGTGLAPALWHPVIEELIEEEVVDKTQIAADTPTGRVQVYTILQLKAA